MYLSALRENFLAFSNNFTNTFQKPEVPGTLLLRVDYSAYLNFTNILNCAIDARFTDDVSHCRR